MSPSVDAPLHGVRVGVTADRRSDDQIVLSTGEKESFWSPSWYLAVQIADVLYRRIPYLSVGEVNIDTV